MSIVTEFYLGDLRESATHAIEILKLLLDREFNATTGIKATVKQATTESFNSCMYAWSRAAKLNP
jgi:hypothetical protein